MARPLRIEFPGACYHVIQRGNYRFPVFGEDRDRVTRYIHPNPAWIPSLREAGQQRALQAWVSLEDVTAAVATHYGCDPQDLLRRHRRGDDARQVLLYLAATCCRGRYTLTEIGQRLGGLTVGGLCAGRYKLEQRLRRDRGLAAAVRAVQQGLTAERSSFRC